MDSDRIVQQAEAALRRHPHVIFAYLFGSVALGRAHPASDVDIAVYLEESADFTEEKLAILGSLMCELETDAIDLVLCNTAPLPLQARIIRHKVILLDRDPFARHRFESLVLRKYFDFSRFEEAMLRRRFSRG